MEVILDAGSSLEVKSALLGGDDFAVDGWMVEGEIWKWIFFSPVLDEACVRDDDMRFGV